MSSVLRDERLVDLLVKQATEGVTREEAAEIDRLFANHSAADAQIMERVASALTLAGIREEPMPAALRDRLVRNAAAFSATMKSGGPVDELASRRARPAHRTGGRERLAWFAMAATLLIAVVGWWPRLQGDRGGETQTQQPPTVAQVCRQVFAAAPSAVQGSWGPTGDAASTQVKGVVAFDPRTQAGCMRFTGLAANDPQKFQYQLWIFDARQDERYPIDGGVFDIPAGQSEVLVRIDPKITVKEPVMFAVTMEKPGGVVVSGREHIVALAKAATT
jgi:hypothetical protein